MADHFDHFSRADLALRIFLAWWAGISTMVAIAAAELGTWWHAIVPGLFAVALIALLVWLDYWVALKHFFASRVANF